MRAVLYARVSTNRQATADHFSLPVQRDLYEARCREKGYDAGGEYADTDTGTKATRKGYQKLLTDARAGLFEVIVVRSIDRFGRDPDEITVRMAELRQLGVKVDAILSTAQSPDLSPPTRFLLQSIEAFLAGQESAQISSRVRGTMAASAREKHWQGGPAPYGFCREGKGLGIAEAEAEVVRRIFALYADDNMGARTIAVYLNDHGFTTRIGGRWAMQTVRDILTREAYLGTLRWADVTVPEAFPPIIDRSLWERAQARMERRAALPGGRTHTSAYLLSGLLWCGCGARMVGRQATGRKLAHPYRGYVCRAWQDGGAAHGSNWRNADELEAMVVESLLAIPSADQERPSAIPALTAERVILEAEAGGIDGRRKRITDAYARDLFGSDAQFRVVMRDLQIEESRVRERLHAIEREIDDVKRREAERESRPDRLQGLLSDDMSPQEKKAVLHTFVHRVEVRPGDPLPTVT